MSELKTIRQAIRPLLMVNFLFGMGVFEFRKKQPPKIIEYAYTLFYLVLYISVSKFSLPFCNILLLSHTVELNRGVFNEIFYINAVLMSALVVTSRITAKTLRKVIVLVESCDQTMENIGLPKRYHSLFLYQIRGYGICGLFIVLIALEFFYWHLTESMIFFSLVLALLSHAPLLLITTCDVSFCFWVNKYLKLKFHQLNQLLHGMLTTTSDSPQHKRVLEMQYDSENKKFTSFRNHHVRGSNANANTMRAVKQIHLELIKIARTMNAAYGIQILLMVTVSFIIITSLFYLFYRILWLDLNTTDFLRTTMPTCCWIFTYTLKIFYINHVCAKTSAEAANAGDIICELYEPSTSREFRAEIRDFTLQLIQNPLVFTACGFFDMDHAFIQGVVGSITTYLVILIQVGDMTKQQQFPNSTVFGEHFNQTVSTLQVDTST
ncbi:Putative gustatory receptor 28b [Anthophora plagiata]